MAIEIHGTCAPRFARVRDRFAAHFEAGEETGASLALVWRGELQLDLWAGHRDARRTLPWGRDTIANVYSTTKGMTALVVHRLVEQGRLDLDAPVARHWPEFAAAGKERLPVRFLLSHQAGLPAVERPLPDAALYDPDTMASALAEQKPWWEPGARHGYHALTFGWLLGELVRRATGETLGRVFRREIAGPLGADFWIGLGPEHDARSAELIPAPLPKPGEANLVSDLLASPDSMAAKAFFNPNALLASPNTRRWRAAEIPAANGHGNARALARIYGALAQGGEIDGVRVLAPAGVERALAEQASGPDAVLPLPTRMALGFMLGTELEPLGPNPRAFGHGGAGGSLGVADPDAGFGFGYVMNQMKMGLWLVDPRPRALLREVYTALG